MRAASYDLESDPGRRKLDEQSYEESSEYSDPNGDRRNDGLTEMTYAVYPQYRGLCAESIFECGSRAGVWRLERLLTEFKTRLLAPFT